MNTKTYMGTPCAHGHDGERYIKSNYCAPCVRARDKVKRTTDPEYLAKRRARNRDNPLYRAGRQEAVRKAKEKRPEHYAMYRRKYNGLPEPTRPKPLTCECCDLRCSTGRALSLDHCHVSGEFRGWLCNSCNLAIGKLGESVAGLMNAVRYLERAAKGGSDERLRTVTAMVDSASEGQTAAGAEVSEAA